MFVFTPEFDSVCAYIDGIHAATGCLTGFREWLIVHLDGGHNLIWQLLVKSRLQNESIPKTKYITSLGLIIEEFHRFTGPTTGGTNGLMRIYIRYHGWLLNQKWYKPDWSNYVPPYDGILNQE